MVQEWLVFSLISLVMWGLWGVFAKMATSSGLDWKQISVVSTLVATVANVLIYLVYRPVIDFKNIGFFYALLVGATIIGGYTFYMALSSGKASVVVPLTALYPIITVVLSFLILKESINLTQGLGIILAIASIVLLSM